MEMNISACQHEIKVNVAMPKQQLNKDQHVVKEEKLHWDNQR